MGRAIIGGDGPRRIIFLAILALSGLGLWTAYYTVPSDSVVVLQRFGKKLKNVVHRDPGWVRRFGW